ncbi:hypothetical protein CROQUDRAFT_247829 [Cronartium quercuum f. sp. fusiforme G11]|uniref:Uncharacterized protein n=1 Tax=Cronartium quercuum f. sp. fusiforme G11 TaxID=708437 RepID=A0A9P6NV51_9BASI|nr:hypothetical protein CROQUDRAFT_247829 [Cronartium quercuum f. sp. fusiforme G11]
MTTLWPFSVNSASVASSRVKDPLAFSSSCAISFWVFPIIPSCFSVASQAMICACLKLSLPRLSLLLASSRTSSALWEARISFL